MPATCQAAMNKTDMLSALKGKQYDPVGSGWCSKSSGGDEPRRTSHWRDMVGQSGVAFLRKWLLSQVRKDKEVVPGGSAGRGSRDLKVCV